MRRDEVLEVGTGSYQGATARQESNLVGRAVFDTSVVCAVQRTNALRSLVDRRTPPKPISSTWTRRSTYFRADEKWTSFQRALGPHNGYGSVWGEELNTHTRTTTIEQQTFRKSKNDWSIKRSPLTYLNLLYPCGHPKRGVLACPKFPPPLATGPNPDFFPKRPAHLSVIGFKEKIDPLNAVPGGIYLNQRFVSFFLHSSINLHL